MKNIKFNEQELNVLYFLLIREQHQDFKNGFIRINNDGYNQGGSNVHAVVEKWLEQLHQNIKD